MDDTALQFESPDKLDKLGTQSNDIEESHLYSTFNSGGLIENLPENLRNDSLHREDF